MAVAVLRRRGCRPFREAAAWRQPRRGGLAGTDCPASGTVLPPSTGLSPRIAAPRLWTIPRSRRPHAYASSGPVRVCPADGHGDVRRHQLHHDRCAPRLCRRPARDLAGQLGAGVRRRPAGGMGNGAQRARVAGAPDPRPNPRRCAAWARWAEDVMAHGPAPHVDYDAPIAPEWKTARGADHFDPQREQDLRLRPGGAQAGRPRHPSRRDLCPARAERRRQDHADQHHLRHRQRQHRHRARRRPRHRGRVPRGARQDRTGAAGAVDRRVRNGVGDGELQPRPVRQAAQSRASGKSAARPVAVGQARQQDHDAVRRHEAARADRQGAGARAADPVPRRTYRRCRRRAAPRHVADGARAARERRHHHPDHALHRRGRGNGRPHRRDQQRRADRGRGQAHADAQARQEAADPAAAGAAGRSAGGAGRLRARAGR